MCRLLSAWIGRSVGGLLLHPLWSLINTSGLVMVTMVT